jgi:hypothetical protein
MLSVQNCISTRLLEAQEPNREPSSSARMAYLNNNSSWLEPAIARPISEY